VGFTNPRGEGPGGQAAINCSTHRGVVVDEFGQNFKLIHLPPNPVPNGTPLDNNGDPCGTGTAGPASVYTIAATTIPQVLFNNKLTTLGSVGDPSTLTVDPIHNLAYMLADTLPTQHYWGKGVGGSPPPSALFLVRMDLSSPVLGQGQTAAPARLGLLRAWRFRCRSVSTVTCCLQFATQTRMAELTYRVPPNALTSPEKDKRNPRLLWAFAQAFSVLCGGFCL